MAANTQHWLRRSKKKFPTSQEAWQDIVADGSYDRSRTTVAHTRYFWRWRVNRTQKTFQL